MTEPNFPYYNVVDQIYHVEWTTDKFFRLELLRESIAELWPAGHPSKLIHVVGTGGKGSTCRFLEVGLSCAGNTGAFMSPHIFDYRERFSINGEFVSQEDVIWAWEERVRPHCVRSAMRGQAYGHTFHEVGILMALTLFDKYEVTWAAVEAGVGGRYDQTRALDAVATVLTNVGTDHAHILGAEQWQRVLDKAGAARRDVPFFTSDHNRENLAIIESVCAGEGAPLRVITQADVDMLVAGLQQHHLIVEAEALLNASYQKWNATLAQTVIGHLCPEIDEQTLLSAFTKARLLGRFWHVSERVYADIAHNAEKVNALAGEIRDRFDGSEKILILGMSGKRVPSQVFAALSKVAKTIIVTGASYKGQEPGKVQKELSALSGGIPVLVISDPRQALDVAHRMQRADDVIILTGSTYMIEQVLNPDPYLRSLSATYGWRTHYESEATGTVQINLPKPSPLMR